MRQIWDCHGYCIQTTSVKKGFRRGVGAHVRTQLRNSTILGRSADCSDGNDRGPAVQAQRWNVSTSGPGAVANQADL